MTTAKAEPATTYIDEKSGQPYSPCLTDTGEGPCLRYGGHAMTKGGHRPSLARPIDPRRAAAAAAWKALTPDEQQAELARRQQVKAARKAEAKAKPAAKATKPAAKRAAKADTRQAVPA